METDLTSHPIYFFTATSIHAPDAHDVPRTTKLFGRSRKLPGATKYGWTKPDENGWIASVDDSNNSI